MSAATPDCTNCGACCAFSDNWPEFVPDDDVDDIPDRLIDMDHGRMKCNGDRCLALEGEIGKRTRCAVYAHRPAVCRDFEPGTEHCDTVRRYFKLAA